jgi:hypothetical protein
MMITGRTAATVIGRKRAVIHNLLSYAVEQELLRTNPLTSFTWKRPKRVEQVDPRVVINSAQARELLTAVTYVGQSERRGRRVLDVGTGMGSSSDARADPRASGLAVRRTSLRPAACRGIGMAQRGGARC